MTNPTQEIPAEELKRIKNDAEHMYPGDSAHNSLMNFGYQKGAKAEYIRARQGIDIKPLVSSVIRWIVEKCHVEDGHIYYQAFKDDRDNFISEFDALALYMSSPATRQQAQGETTVCRFVKAIERLPSRNGDYNGRYNINRCVIDIRKGEIYELRGLPHIIPSDQVEIEYLEWLEELPAQAENNCGTTITEPVTYPVGGYAPGNYYGKCTSCGKEFRGDKRAFQCEPCGKTDEKLQGYMISVLGFVAEKYSLPNGGQSLLDEYKKHIYDTFIKEYRNGK